MFYYKIKKKSNAHLISSLPIWNNGSEDVTPITTPLILIKLGSGKQCTFGYFLLNLYGGVGYTGWWWASLCEETKTIWMLQLKKKKTK